jgi:hypothetical protein
MKPGFSRALFIERGFSPGKRRRDPRLPGVDPSLPLALLGAGARDMAPGFQPRRLKPASNHLPRRLIQSLRVILCSDNVSRYFLPFIGLFWLKPVLSRALFIERDLSEVSIKPALKSLSECGSWNTSRSGREIIVPLYQRVMRTSAHVAIIPAGSHALPIPQLLKELRNDIWSMSFGPRWGPGAKNR